MQFFVGPLILRSSEQKLEIQGVKRVSQTPDQW